LIDEELERKYLSNCEVLCEARPLQYKAGDDEHDRARYRQINRVMQKCMLVAISDLLARKEIDLALNIANNYDQHWNGKW